MISSIEIEKGSQSGMGGAAVLGGIATFKTLEASEFLKDGKSFGGRVRAGSGLGEMGNGTYFNGGGVFAFGNDIGDALFAYSERHLVITAAEDRMRTTWGIQSGSKNTGVKPGTTG